MTAFAPRLIEPERNVNRFYFKDNIFEQSGYGMPNCTAYAWGRFFEITGTRPRLDTGNAGGWYGYTQDGYSRGSTPRVGAIACFRKPGTTEDQGHVAVVEQVFSDGSYRTSNSDYGGRYFHTALMSPGEGYGSSDFQGFIYPPITFDRSWIGKNDYLGRSDQEHNAVILIDYFRSKGWTDNAIAALLGNMEVESTVNPAIWESLTVDRSAGYGLVQWTPATKFIDYVGADSGWDVAYNREMDRIQAELYDGLGGQYIPTDAYPETGKEFIKSTKSAYYLAGAFLYNYERPAAPDPADRGTRANVWYDFITGHRPPEPPGKGLPLWMIIKLSRGDL